MVYIASKITMFEFTRDIKALLIYNDKLTTF